MAVVAAMAVAGCGGDSGPSLKAYAEDANKICLDGGREIKELGQPKTDTESLGKYAGDLARILSDGAEEIKGLDRPSGDDGKKAKEFADAYEQDINENYVPALEKVQEEADAGNKQETVQALQEFSEVESPKADGLSKEIGAPDCAG